MYLPNPPKRSSGGFFFEQDHEQHTTHPPHRHRPQRGRDVVPWPVVEVEVRRAFSEWQQATEPAAEGRTRLVLRDVGVYGIVLRAEDTTGRFSLQSFNLEVNPANDIDNENTFFQSDATSLYVWFVSPLMMREMSVTALRQDGNPVVQRIAIVEGHRVLEQRDALVLAPIVRIRLACICPLLAYRNITHVIVLGFMNMAVRVNQH